MAVSVAVVKSRALGNGYETIFDLTFDSSYPTGGEALAAGDFAEIMPQLSPSLATKSAIQFFAAEPTTANANYVYDRTNGKVLIFTSGSTEAANASDQSAKVARCRILYGVVN